MSDSNSDDRQFQAESQMPIETQMNEPEKSQILDYISDMSLELAQLAERAGHKTLASEFYKARAKVQRTPRERPKQGL